MKFNFARVFKLNRYQFTLLNHSIWMIRTVVCYLMFQNIKSFDSQMSTNKNLSQWFDFNQSSFLVSFDSVESFFSHFGEELHLDFFALSSTRTLHVSVRFPGPGITDLYLFLLSDFKYTGFPSCDIMSVKPTTELLTHNLIVFL